MNIDERYKKGKIYKLICSETLNIYYGSTIRTLKQRLRKHRCKDNDCQSKYFVEPVIELIEDYPCNNRRELEKREQYFIENFECVNKYKSYMSEEDRKEYDKKYHQDNKEYYKEYMKKYIKENREKLNEKVKKYREENKEKIKEIKNQKFNCDCGGQYNNNE